VLFSGQASTTTIDNGQRWDFVFNPDTGEFVYDTTLRCRSSHAFLMTPKEK
jgi:hypothetical protein